MSALHGAVQHISGYDPRCIEVALDDGGHDLKPDDEVAVHAVKHAGAEAGETFGQVLGEMLGDAYGVKVMEQLGELEAIVRDLAALDAPLVDLDREVLGDWVCLACPEDHAEYETWQEDSEVVHHESCTWRRAVEFVSAHPVSGDQQ